MVSEARLESIDLCPLCRSDAVTNYLQVPYVDSELEAFLFRYYNLGERFGKVAYREIFDGHSYILSRCESCRLRFQKNRPNATLLEIVYDTWIGSTASGRSAFSRYTLDVVQHYLSEALRLIAFIQHKTGTKLSELRALDYGLGNGGFALALKSTCIEVSGFEFSEIRRSFAESNGIKTYRTDEEIPVCSFHLINTEQVMEHVPTPHDLIARFSNALVPGGILKISVPLSKSINAGDESINWSAGRYERKSPTALQPLEHLQYYPPESYDQISEQFGFKRVHMPFSYHIKYGLNWSATGTIKNFGRAFMHESMRNYVLLQKE